MSGPPQITGWSSITVVGGNTAKDATGGSCAIMDFDKNYKSDWLKVQMVRRFNVAYIELNYPRYQRRMLNVFLSFY